jgi:hypothetical protein
VSANNAGILTEKTARSAELSLLAQQEVDAVSAMIMEPASMELLTIAARGKYNCMLTSASLSMLLY